MYLCHFSTVWKRFQLSSSHDHRRSIKSVCTQSGGTWINKMGLSRFNNRFWYLGNLSDIWVNCIHCFYGFIWHCCTFFMVSFYIVLLFYVTLYYINSRVTRIWHKIFGNKYIPFLLFLSLFVEFLQWFGLGWVRNLTLQVGRVGSGLQNYGLGWVGSAKMDPCPPLCSHS